MTLKTSSPSPRLADPALLEKIDQLFAYNIGEYISLPQLVVVGEQSSGKSSVLEGLTKMAFPRDSGLCTRYATQIVFRRNLQMTDRKITASIVPAADTAPERAKELRGWRADDLQALDARSFARMMAEVQKLMGLSMAADDGLPAFSSDVLRLEIQGPDQEHLSVIDVPGTFENTTPGLTTKDDKNMIDKMVLHYMNNPRSIILAVIPANVDVATQKVDQTARDIDPDGIRTLRVLTKPDLVDKGVEQKVVSLVNGRGSQSELGWVLVRNLGHSELQEGTVDRDEAEKSFYRRNPWNYVDPQKFGIQALKSRLQELLTSNVRREFASVRNEVSSKLKTAKNAIHLLGAEREEPGQQRKYLLDIVTHFQRITQNALSTNYGTSDEFERYSGLRLATLVVNRDTKFSQDMADYGHEHEFDTEHSIEGQDADESSQDTSDPVPQDLKKRSVIRTRKLTTSPQLEDVLPEHVVVTDPVKGEIEHWIKGVVLKSRGFEIGTFSPHLLSTIMKTQSSRWPAIAHGYITDVITIVHQFVRRALEIACPESRVRTSLLTVMMDGLVEKYSGVIEQVDFLLRIERAGRPRTLNKSLGENLHTCRKERIEPVSAEDMITGYKDGKVVRVNGLVNSQSTSSDVDRIVRELYDILKSYYAVALERFVDNVCMQGAHFLVTGDETPMSLFSPSFVSSLTDKQLEEIAGEDAGVGRRRAQLKKEIQELEMGRKILV